MTKDEDDMMEPKTAAANALESVLEARAGESILIVTDDVRLDVAGAFAQGAIELGLWTRMVVLETKEEEFRKTPPKHLVEMINSPLQPDIFVNTLRGNAEETPFRISVIKLCHQIRNKKRKITIRALSRNHYGYAYRRCLVPYS